MITGLVTTRWRAGDVRLIDGILTGETERTTRDAIMMVAQTSLPSCRRALTPMERYT